MRKHIIITDNTREKIELVLGEGVTFTQETKGKFPDFKAKNVIELNWDEAIKSVRAILEMYNETKEMENG